MRAQEPTDRSKEESPIEIAAEPLRPATGIDEESPEGILDGRTTEVLESVAPAIFGGQVNKHEAVLEAAGAGAVTIADVSTNGVDFGFGTVNGTSSRTTFDGYEVSKGRRGFRIGGYVKSSAKVWEQIVIEFAASKHAFELQG
jgi:hypothetical protein